MTLKERVFEALLAELEGRLTVAAEASRDAAAHATDEECRADSKWDTQGLEASYLAAGQASHTRDIAESMLKLRNLQSELLTPKTVVATGSLITCRSGESIDTYFLIPFAGGETLMVDEMEITTIGPVTPVGRALLGKRRNEPFELPNGMVGVVAGVE